ncbi:MAG: homogentisate 1,2-dioxygenase [Euzebyales bacterium]|nr:homogentisate 1,2-dioxygenase [Euzebyales bacterium]
MAYYRQVGEIPHKRHTQFRRPDGGLYAEELMGVEGFNSDASLLYHRYLPTAITAAEPVHREPDPLVGNHPLKPRHLKTHQLKLGGDMVDARQLLVANDDVRLSYVAADATSALYRNAIGDEVVYVESGEAMFESVYGAISVGQGDYLVIPTSTTHRWKVADGVTLRALVIEASGHVAPPKRYLSSRGQFLEHSPYCERDLRGPTEPLLAEADAAEVLVRHRHGMTRYTYGHHPFDVVGWDGCLYPYAFNVADFEPITGRIHQPPPVHQTFEGPNFVICSFVPRKFDYHPQGIPAPYNHANVDSDEMLFYVGGDFMSRKGAGIELGSISLHPSGFTHGPQPGSVEASIGKDATDELAVMVDTFRPLRFGPAALSCEDSDYAWTWARGVKTEAFGSH